MIHNEIPPRAFNIQAVLPGGKTTHPTESEFESMPGAQARPSPDTRA